MSDVVLTALIAAIVPAVFSVVILIINNRQTLLLAKLAAAQAQTDATVAETRTAIEETKVDVAATKVAVGEVVLHTNSMKDALVRVTGEAEFAKGLKEGQGEARPTEPSVSLSLPVDTTITVPKQTLKVETKEKP